MSVTTIIPKQFIRIWLGPKLLPPLFEEWWAGFKTIHPDFDFITLTDDTEIELPPALEAIYYSVDTYAGRSDILRLLALYELGGIYIDTDMMPLKSLEPLLSDKPFIGQRSSKSFATGVIGCPAKHPAMRELINSLPTWYLDHKDHTASVQTGPAFVSSVWFGRSDVNHLPITTFYPYNGFMAPKRDERMRIFQDKQFPPEMLAAHFGNHMWGGKPIDAH
jgi:mannosyltransferase OCH1-like enzyme